MAIKLNFKFRTPRKDKNGVRQDPKGERVLQICLRVNGVKLDQYYSSGVWVLPGEWNQKDQVAIGRGKNAQAINDHLNAIRAEHHFVLNRQISLGKIPTPFSVYQEWAIGVTPPPTLLAAYDKYIAYLGSKVGSEAMKESSLEMWGFGRKFLTQFLKSRRQGDIELREITVGFGKEYHAWLMGGGTKRTAGTATLYARHLSNVLDEQVREKHLDVNPLYRYRWPRSKAKKVYFLEDQHLAALAGLNLTRQSAQYRDLCLLMCYTGFDYPDLITFLSDPDRHITQTRSGIRKISGLRNKTEVNFQVPILSEAEPLIALYQGRTLPHHSTINKYMSLFEGMIGWEGKKVTAKILRKTAGALFLNAGYSLEFVSKLLGHSSTNMTQKHYAHLIDKRVDAEIDKVGIHILPKPTGGHLPTSEPV